MMDIKSIRKEMEAELVDNILPFWMNRMKDEVNGGFYGRITGTGVLMPEAEKGHFECTYSLDIFGCLPPVKK